MSGGATISGGRPGGRRRRGGTETRRTSKGGGCRQERGSRGPGAGAITGVLTTYPRRRGEAGARPAAAGRLAGRGNSARYRCPSLAGEVRGRTRPRGGREAEV